MRKLFLLLPPSAPAWMLLPLLDRDYRRLVLWSYGLGFRVQVMGWVMKLCGPFVTPGLAAWLRRQSDALSDEVAALRKAVSQRLRGAGMAQVHTQPNPWV